MARKMKKFSAGGAQGRYERRMADIEKDYAKAMTRKTGKDAEVVEAKRQQRIADAKDDLAKRTGADRTATRAAERAAESNLTKTRKYGAAKSVSAEAPATTAKITDNLPTPKMDSSIGKKAAAKPPVRRSTTTPPRTNTSASTPTVRTDKGAGASNLPGDQGFSSKSKNLKTGSTKAGTAPAGVSAALLAPKGSSSRSGSLFGSMFKTSDAFKKAQEAKYGKRTPLVSGTDTDALLTYGDAAAKKNAAKKNPMAKGGSVKKGKTMKYAKGGSTPPQPTPAERAAGAKFRESIKNIKPTPAQGKILEKTGKNMAKGGKAATKFGAAMVKKSADTKGRAMVKKACGGGMKKYASGGLVAGHKSADGCATKGKTKGKMV